MLCITGMFLLLMRAGVWRWVCGHGLEVPMYVEGGIGVCIFWSSGSVRAMCVRVWLYGGLVGRGEGVRGGF